MTHADGRVDEHDAEGVVHPVAHLAGQTGDVRSGRSAAVGDRQRVLGRQRCGTGHPVPLAEAGLVDEPRGARLDQPLPRSEDRRHRTLGAQSLGRPLEKLVHLRGRQDRVGEEGATAPRVVVALVEDHAPIAALGEHRVPCCGERHPIALLDTELTGEVGIGHGCGEPAPAEREGHLEDDIPAGGLEDRVAVGELAVRGRKEALTLLLAVPRQDARDGLRDLLTVGTDILHGGRAGQTGDAGECLDARPALGHGAGDDLVPHLTGGDGHLDLVAVCALDAHPLGRDAHHGAAEALVRDDEVGPTGQEQKGAARLVSDAHGPDDLVGGLGSDQGVGRTAHTHGGQRRQRGAVLGAHHQSSWTTARQRPRTLSPPEVTVSSTVACLVSASSLVTTPSTSS